MKTKLKMVFFLLVAGRGALIAQSHRVYADPYRTAVRIQPYRIPLRSSGNVVVVNRGYYGGSGGFGGGMTGAIIGGTLGAVIGGAIANRGNGEPKPSGKVTKAEEKNELLRIEIERQRLLRELEEVKAGK